ncbi:MAG: inositol monophosphatase [Chloroflexota bacterium]|nr:inositol monophosphatase [Chloroflexota bacterium]
MDRDLITEARMFAVDLARETGVMLRQHFSEARDIEHKGTIDIVTDADRAAETLIATAIRERYPEHRLLAEEGATAAEDGASPYRWVVDPLDGTTNFAHHYPHFAVCIGLEREGELLVGAVYEPMRDEMFEAAKGQGARLNGQPIHVSRRSELIASLLASGFPYDLSAREVSNRLWVRFNDQCQGVRRDGAAALNIVYVAAGRLDGYWERPVMPWDKAAACLVAMEAGAIVTGLTGEPFDVDDLGATVANPELHAVMVSEILAELEAIEAGVQ